MCSGLHVVPHSPGKKKQIPIKMQIKGHLKERAVENIQKEMGMSRIKARGEVNQKFLYCFLWWKMGLCFINKGQGRRRTSVGIPWFAFWIISQHRNTMINKKKLGEFAIITNKQNNTCWAAGCGHDIQCKSIDNNMCCKWLRLLCCWVWPQCTTAADNPSLNFQ